MSGTPGGTTVLDIIEKRLIPNEEAKRARGEVFTPLHIVRELLYGVRKEPLEKGIVEPWGVDPDGKLFDDPAERVGGIPLEVWKNPESKWLDPANGIGNFPYIAFQMLDHQLRDVLKETVARRKHIVEKMLFMIEIDKGNVNTSFKIFEQLAPGAVPNICCADTLKLKDADLTKEFGTAKFDVVMGNPPFQNKAENQVGTTAGRGTLWDEFIDTCILWVVPSGFFTFINPPPWRKPMNKYIETLTKKRQMLYIHIFGEKAVSSMFHVSSRVDAYIIENKPKYKNTDIIDETGKYISINVDEWSFLPNYAYDDISKIITDSSTGIKVIYNTIYHSAPSRGNDKPKLIADNDYKFPVVHGITQNGLALRYVKNNTLGQFGVSKVLLNKNRNQYPFNDFEGKYGMTELTFGIPISSKEEGDAIVKAINTDRFKEIIKATKWGAFQTEYKMFKYFKPDFYKEFLPKEGAARRRTRRNKKQGTRRRSL
jgi:hypothetical protein